jgi:hypothetical protein
VTTVTLPPLPKLRCLPASLPLEGAVRVELEEGIPIFRASKAVQAQIEALLRKQRVSRLSAEDEEELDLYEEIDDHLSFLNRVTRNLLHPRGQQD